MKKKLILFIHGLGGNPLKTWGKFPELLKSDMEIYHDFDIEHFSFPTSIFRFPFGQILPKIQDLAEGLRSEINIKYSSYDEIVIVCHSLGGLVGKKYILEEIKSKNRLRVSKILLYATPNNGATLASAGSTLTWCNLQINQLKKTSDFVELLNEDWYKYKIEEVIYVKYIVAAQDKIVDKHSAKNIWGNNSYDVIVGKNHGSVVKPIDKTDLTFIYLKNFLQSKSKKDEYYDEFIEACSSFSREQIELQKRSKKYIPEVFTEITDIKEIGRYYADPVLMLMKLIEELQRINYARINEFIFKYKLDRIPFELQLPSSDHTQLENISLCIKELKIFVNNIIRWINEFQNKVRALKLGGDFSDVQKYSFQWEKYEYESLFKHKRKLEEIGEKLTALDTQVLIVTSPAGHGKTNFVCDLVENVLFKRNVPSLLFFGKDFYESDIINLEESILQRINYKSQFKSFPDIMNEIGIKFFQNNKPLVIVIDGLNEQKNYALFSSKLQLLIKTLIQFNFVRIILTCRSEYFQIRFNELLISDISGKMYLKEDFDSRIRELDRNKIFNAYTKFFHYRILDISDSVWRKLTEDPLFLRIFSEAYGDSNSSRENVIQGLTHLYKNKVFQKYFDKKKQELSLGMQSDSMLKTYSKEMFERTLESIIEIMFDNRIFMNLPKAKLNFSKDYFDELDRIIDNDILIQETLTDSAGKEECINFTFDEFRDYLLAKYILKKIGDLQIFENILDELITSRGIVSEGFARYIFYAYKESKNNDLGLLIKRKDWYERVFCEEIFSIDDELVDKLDLQYLSYLFKSNRQYSLVFVKKLIHRIKIEQNPILNISILLDIISGLSDSDYKNLIAPIFVWVNDDYYGAYRSDNLQMESFYDFLDKTISGENGKNIFEYLYYFELILLLMDDSTDVSAISFEVYEAFSIKYPEQSSLIILKYINQVKSLSLLDSICSCTVDLIKYGINFSDNFFGSIELIFNEMMNDENTEKVLTISFFYKSLYELNKILLDNEKIKIIESKIGC